MKKLIIVASLVLVQSVMVAGVLPSDDGGVPQSKLERIQNQIDEYTKIITDFPVKLQAKINNFSRVKGLGNDIQQVLTTYVTATDECINGAHSAIGQKACGDFENLDLGSEIKEKKKRVMEMITEAERELKSVKAEQKDIPLIEKLLKSLNVTKTMMMK